MRVSIGLLAYNESQNIRSTLTSLFQQSLFSNLSDYEALEIIVVPNGCTDNTAQIARESLSELTALFRPPQLRWQVCELQQPGKCNAWNHYVHYFSDVEADNLILIDADIEFLNPDTLQNLLRGLEENSDAWVTKDVPIKDIALKSRKNLFERLSAKVTDYPESAICGQLYCARARVVRQIWMPLGLSVEDGFLAATIKTDLFTTTEDKRRVRLVPNASHVFEAYVSLPKLLDHEKRIVLGTIVNAYLFAYLWANCSPSQDAGVVTRTNYEQNPYWVKQIVDQAFTNRGWWLIPNWMMFRRLASLRKLPLPKMFLKLPVALTAFCVDQLVFLRVNQQLHKQERGLGYWRSNDSSMPLPPASTQ